MTQAIDKILEKVYNGQVIDDEGTWVSIDKRLEVTKKILDRLTQGKILCEGRWVSIAQAREKLGKKAIIDGLRGNPQR
jgi:hypothetical protein